MSGRIVGLTHDQWVEAQKMHEDLGIIRLLTQQDYKFAVETLDMHILSIEERLSELYAENERLRVALGENYCDDDDDSWATDFLKKHYDSRETLDG